MRWGGRGIFNCNPNDPSCDDITVIQNIKPALFGRSLRSGYREFRQYRISASLALFESVGRLCDILFRFELKDKPFAPIRGGCNLIDSDLLGASSLKVNDNDNRER